MDRRQFLGSAALASGLLSLPFAKARAAATSVPPSAGPGAPVVSIETLRRWHDRYEAALFEDYIPFADRYVTDNEFGGFMCDVGPDGVRTSDEKAARYQARGAWVYAFLYNHFDKKPEYLETSRKALDLFLRYKRPTMETFLPEYFDRQGNPTKPDSNDIFVDLFLAEALQEYAEATGDDAMWEKAREVLFNAVRLYDKPDFLPEVTIAIYSKPGEAPANWAFNGRPLEPLKGARFQAVWFAILRCATQMLEYREEADVRQLADRCVDAVLKHHFNPRFNLTNEFINHDFSRPNNEYEGQVYLGHAMETAWMILYEAVRRRDRKTFDVAAERFRRHVTVATDDVYGGVFRNLANVDTNELSLDKALWCQEEVLIGALSMIEHTGDHWAARRFAELFDYVQANFPVRRHGVESPYWVSFSETRIVKFNPKGRMRVENYHHPRHLMENLLALRRIIDRGGAVSGVVYNGDIRAESGSAEAIPITITITSTTHDAREGHSKEPRHWLPGLL